jgi:periplasmic divalent cation tolerance protein
MATTSIPDHDTSSDTQALPSSTYVVAFVTAPAAGDVAAGLARAIVEAQLAACVNIVPAVTSVYRWEGKTQTDTETLMVIKTVAALQDELTAFVRANHPYSVPEVVFLPVVAGSAPYLAWISDSTRVGRVGTGVAGDAAATIATAAEGGGGREARHATANPGL